MSSSEQPTVTQLIAQLAGGDAKVADQLFPLVYDKLRALADDLLRHEPRQHTLQPTALVHEAYMKLAGNEQIDWRGRAHFSAVAARAMREVLVDYARRKKAQKRGGAWERVTLAGLGADDPGHDVDLLALDEALDKLSEVNPRAARVVELTYFSRMTADEVASVVGVSDRTVCKDLTIAQAWLLRTIDRDADR